eukprot:CAMPEP_0196661114 /NCGR_PEP_ID=MMETSP1086-20130531/42746_1 /TAXON_ID=77921 /ORGANISM="Cyanoptyche  gloeocystis , Strain SAG4.97" /LENGTH=498 /DNA_ID=CAMNT_0041995867 /DNA_START=31 /DNA_END=1525 /DNA_ORIENTATION=-
MFTEAEKNSGYDITQKIAPYLDRHFIFPLLEFLQQKEIYPADELLKVKLDLLRHTNMADYAMDIYKKLNNTEDVPQAMKEWREDVLGRLRRLITDISPFPRLAEDKDEVTRLRQNKQFTAQHLEENFGISQDAIENTYGYAKWQYECGNYSSAAEFLMYYRALSVHPDKNFSALWGKLAAEILMQSWDTALDDMTRLKDAIETRSFTSALAQLEQRTWLIHWSLFIFFNHPNGRNVIIDLFFTDKYLNAIQTKSPWILRYLAAAVVTNKKRRHFLKDLVKVIQHEQYTYADPITDFLYSLYANYDFDAAHANLRECQKVLQNDFFLVSCQDEFMENARLFVFETYCRIHRCIDITLLASQLSMEKESAERWVVNLIRNAKLDAKIDSQANHVIIASNFPSVYQQVIENTKGLLYRSDVVLLASRGAYSSPDSSMPMPPATTSTRATTSRPATSPPPLCLLPPPAASRHIPSPMLFACTLSPCNAAVNVTRCFVVIIMW